MASASDFDYVKHMTPADYVFPADRLKRTCDPGRTPLVLVACGSCELYSRAYGSPFIQFANANYAIAQSRQLLFYICACFRWPPTTAETKVRNPAPLINKCNLNKQ
jgi:hypothetical protein